MRTCVINSSTGIVENVIELGLPQPKADIDRFKEDTEPPEGYLWVQSDVAGRGWRYVDGSLVPPEAE